MMPVLMGVDVSSYQGDPDWAAVAASGRSFAITKATEGVGYVNPYFADNWPAIRAAGLTRGAYHFARPSRNTAPAEVAFFLQTVGALETGDFVALDLEDTDVAQHQDLHQWALDFLSLLEDEIGFAPLLYSGTWYLGPHGCLNVPGLGSYGLWLSGYQANMPAVPADWSTMALWQYTDQAHCPGINGPVDQSYFLGDLDQLKQYGRPATMPAPNPTPLPAVSDQLVTILSVIGDATYGPNGSDAIDIQALMPNQSVSRQVFIRELVQQAKALLGA